MTIDDPGRIRAPTGCGDAPHFTAPCLTSEFANVFIVVDSKALQGKGIGAGVAADCLVMLALSQTKGRWTAVPPYGTLFSLT